MTKKRGPTAEVKQDAIGRRHTRKDGTWYCCGWDLTKNVWEVFGSSGNIRTTYSYTPYGEVTAQGNVSQPVQWSSEMYDEDLGLVYYNYRHYNPHDGRWINRDPIAEQSGWNLYGFVGNGPIAIHDLLGNKATNADLVALYMNWFRSKDYYDTDEFELSSDIKKIIDEQVLSRVKWQITDIIRKLVSDVNARDGVNIQIYNTNNSYNFGSVLWVLGSGTVSTESHIVYRWNTFASNIFMEVREFAWTADIYIYYNDIFEDPTDIESVTGIPLELGNNYSYGHQWQDTLSDKGQSIKPCSKP